MTQVRGTPLTQTGLTQAAQSIGVEIPLLWTVMTVETKGCGFLPDRRPLILFERHIFSKRTKGKFDHIAPDLSNVKPGGYGNSRVEHERITRAMALDKQAALESASWGLGQVMGFNAKDAGYPNVEAMVDAMHVSEDLQFGAMLSFMQTNKLTKYLVQQDWAGFASRYNGSNYKVNKYDTKLAEAHDRFSTGALPNLDVRSVQLYLTYLGYTPGVVDGWLGKKTKDALMKFQTDQALSATGQIDSSTLDALEKAAMKETPEGQ